jgi:two-component system, OmpR family, sensor histidine kinase BaeS
MSEGQGRRWGGPPGPNPDWRGRRGQFVRRIGCLFVLLSFSLFLLGGVTWRILFGGGSNGDHGPPVHALLLLIPLGGIMFMIVRGLRRTAEPIGSVMEAADRVAEGDYTVRVDPHGSPPVRGLMFAFNAMTSRLQTNEEQRRMLLADIAHELRNPLAIIRGNVEGMIDGVYPRDDAQLAPLLEETRQMARLLDDLHTLSSVEAGALRLNRESICLASFIRDVTSAFRPQAEAAGITLEDSAAGDGELVIDSVRIRQVIENLILNALRHTPAGGRVEVRAFLGHVHAIIEVSDTGDGIPPDVLPHIFDRFVKSADSGGSGLGLAIAKRLVERHGGTVAASSPPGQGTTIRVTLPVSRE